MIATTNLPSYEARTWATLDATYAHITIGASTSQVYKALYAMGFPTIQPTAGVGGTEVKIPVNAVMSEVAQAASEGFAYTIALIIGTLAV